MHDQIRRSPTGGLHSRYQVRGVDGKWCKSAPELWRSLMAEIETTKARDTDWSACLEQVHHDNLELLSEGSSFVAEEGAVYVDNWNVAEETLYHKHPEFGTHDDVLGKPTVVEWSVDETNTCTLCGATVPDNIWMIHKLHQL